ncbi:MAG: hypothetical protein HZC28_14325 [Spirochaetes bacterium]|nr:hypothetical protein [Spirochaetota bacterium]
MKTFLAVVLVAGSLCAADKPVPGINSRTIIVGEHERHYILYLPKSYDGDKPLPVVIMIHGGGGTSKGALFETGWDRKAEAEGFIVAAPDGLGKDPSKPGNFRTNPPTWNDGSGRFAKNQSGIDDIGFIAAMIDEIIAACRADAKRVYATGFSNGASMTFRTGLALSSRVAAIAPVAGALWITNAVPDRPLPLCYITGTADTLNPLAGGIPKTFTGGVALGEGVPKPPVQANIDTWISLIGCAKEPVSTTISNGVTKRTYAGGLNGTAIESYFIEGCGHTWPGGKSILPVSTVGPTTDKLNATDVIWEFFKRSTR